MIRHVEKQNLRRAGGEQGEKAVIADAFVEPLGERTPDDAELAERDRCDGAGQRGVTDRKSGLCGAPLDHLVERRPAAENVMNGGPGKPPRGNAFDLAGLRRGIEASQASAPRAATGSSLTPAQGRSTFQEAPWLGRGAETGSAAHRSGKLLQGSDAVLGRRVG